MSLFGDLASVAKILFTTDTVNYTSNGLRRLDVKVEGKTIQAIEQNPHTRSTWSEMARTGHKVVQFKDTEAGKLIAVAVDGEIHPYGNPEANAVDIRELVGKK